MRLRTSLLDLKLAFRMLRKHPVLVLAAILANMVAIGAGVVYFDIAHGIANPTLPFEDGEDVITIRNLDIGDNSLERPSLHYFLIWREELEAVETLGVLSRRGASLVTEDGRVEPVAVVRIGAAAFRVPRIRPLLGRPLTESDQVTGAPPVVVIGEDLWDSVFDRNPDILGRSVELGGVTRTVVGVMPSAFALPVNQEIWIPFSTNPFDSQRGSGPRIATIGRLADGVTLEEAQAELTVLGERIGASFPTPNATRLRPRIKRYLDVYGPGKALGRWMMVLNLAFVLLLVVICANVGALVYARIATREGELAVRTALGASRARIVMQFFVEALVLTAAGAVLALVAANWALQTAIDLLLTFEEGGMPFWWKTDLEPTTFFYVGLLTVVAAVIVGVLPALRATRGRIQATLQRRSSGGTDVRSRRIWGAAIVTQIALSGALVPVAIWGMRLASRFESVDLPVQTDRYMVAEFGITTTSDESDGEKPPGINVAYRTLKARFAPQGGAGMTFADELPGRPTTSRPIELAGHQGDDADSGTQTVHVASIGVDFFETLDLPILSGRGFAATDLERDARPIIVNEPFVRQVLGERNAIGRRLRFIDPTGEQPGPWHEIVGIVPDLGMNPFGAEPAPGLYRPVTPAEIPTRFLIVRVGSETGSSLRNLQSTAAAVNPGLRVYAAYPWSEIRRTATRIYGWFTSLLTVGVLFIVFLSAVVTFALLSLAVSRRTREVGVRRALGSGRRSILTAVFSRSFLQLGLGAGLGVVVSVVGLSMLTAWMGLKPAGAFVPDPALILMVLFVILLVGISSCGLPVARALRISPTEAMREDV